MSMARVGGGRTVFVILASNNILFSQFVTIPPHFHKRTVAHSCTLLGACSPTAPLLLSRHGARELTSLFILARGEGFVPDDELLRDGADEGVVLAQQRADAGMEPLNER